MEAVWATGTAPLLASCGGGRPEGGKQQEQRSLRGSDWGPRGVIVRCLIQIQVLGGQAPGSTLAGVPKRSPLDSATQEPRALRQPSPRLSLTRPLLDLGKATCTGGLGYGSGSKCQASSSCLLFSWTVLQRRTSAWGCPPPGAGEQQAALAASRVLGATRGRSRCLFWPQPLDQGLRACGPLPETWPPGSDHGTCSSVLQEDTSMPVARIPSRSGR